MEDYEKLGVFYLGKPYSLKAKKPGEGLLLYDSKDLVTHGVCVGMTGSGKTGLCTVLLEEAAIDGIPCIVIDPKGDLPNLLLTFPDLKAGDFQPWISEDEARKAGVSPEAYAEQQASRWKTGLAEWGQSAERIRRLRQAAEFVIYTPGSTAGVPLSILKSIAAPDRSVLEDKEFLGERISTTVTSLLGLLGIEADPIKSREHILLSLILDSTWRRGEDLTLETLIQSIQTPPVTQVGVLDLEAFYPSQDRFSLVMALNNLLAAPGFSAWLEGDPLDVGQLLYGPAGKPRMSILSIAHLNDAERMSFVSLLLTQVVGWMRAQSGTSSLRAILYMDEVFGYLPPVANPPSKAPLLTLLKQARAFGLGVLLATQNPVDLDYKALSNAGTWMIGRLQTERDKARLLDGLEGAAAGTESKFNRRQVEETIAGLSPRVFLMHNAHEDEPAIFQSRWALSYLRGPLTRNQIKTLMDPFKAARGPARPAARAAARAEVSAPAAAPPARAAAGALAAVPQDVQQFFMPLRGAAPAGSTLVYRPMVLGVAQVAFVDTKTGVDVTNDVLAVTPITEEAIPVDWDAAQVIAARASELERSGRGQAQLEALPSPGAKAKNYVTWGKGFVTWLFGHQKLELLRSPSLDEVSKPAESERDFRVRLQQSARERRDGAVESLRKKYGPKMAALQDRVRRAQQAMAREEEQAKQQKVQTAISFGSTLLGAFMGRKAISSGTLGRATTAARGVSRSMREQEDVSRAKDTLEALEQQLQGLEAEFKAETESLEAKIDSLTEELETISIKPKKTNIAVQLVALAWAPYWVEAGGKASAAWA